MAESVAASVVNTAEPSQRVVKIRRDYNTWVANETLEDYALRFTPESFRKWSISRVANTASGAISFLVLEAIGATIAINYGFINAFWAILAVGLVIFLTGTPISFYAAKYGVDMDLLTRGAGFGYIGSTITSFIYASFTFIFFALEAAIMAYALELAFHIPLYLGYMISALVVIPMVTHGVTLISRIQMITQPIWMLLMALPFVFVLYQDPDIVARLMAFGGETGQGAQFNLLMFGAATTVCIALITQMGEQVDYLRFMPAKTQQNRIKWNLGVLIAGPGWILIGMLKMLGGALLALMVLEAGMSAQNAVNPTHMYLLGFEYVFSSPQFALAVTALFVIVSQIKINMTNAYAGSLAWSNFFARITHSHPGRVVWVVFNVLIAVMLMELNVFAALEQVLALYSNIAISWIAAVVADLIINKPLGLSPKGVEFKRAYLYDINPVGVGAMLLASAVSITAHFGVFGETLQAFSALVALVAAMVASPLIAWVTGGRYYLSRPRYRFPAATKTVKCTICEREYEAQDMAHCPAYQGYICSLCCCLDARCQDVCKPHARFSVQWESALKKVLPKVFAPYLENGLSTYLLLMGIVLGILGGVLGLIYYYESMRISQTFPDLAGLLKENYLKIFAALVFASGIIAWWLTLTSDSRRVAQEESNRQTSLLLREIESHQKTDVELQQARYVAEQANQAKSRYITGMSHELRTPLNSILGYAQMLDNDDAIPKSKRQAIRVIRRSGEHLLSLIEGTLDIARIESGKLTFDSKIFKFPEFIQQIISMFELQAHNKNIGFSYEVNGKLPDYVRADQKRLSQILINVLGNAVKYTQRGRVTFRLHYAREMLQIEVEDTGPGILQEEIETIFEPFARGSAANQSGMGGTGLGLTISKLLTELMGGQMQLQSTVGQGTVFQIKLFLPQAQAEHVPKHQVFGHPAGYLGGPRKILVVDNEQTDREMLINLLQPLGFEITEAANGLECLEKHVSFNPDAILMDLAMPLMDGWEASHIIRAVRQSNTPIAIVSANAFDKGLDNIAGISAEDFFVKPINIDELLAWLGKRLAIEWVAPSSVSAPSTHAQGGSHQQKPMVLPPQAYLDAIKTQLNIGYMRGVIKHLDEVAAQDVQYAVFVEEMRQLAARFEIAAMKNLIER